MSTKKSKTAVRKTAKKTTAKKTAVKAATKKTKALVKEKVIVERSLKWNYPSDCIDKSDRKAFRTQARAKIAKWDKLLTDKVNSKGEKLSKKDLKEILAQKNEFNEKYLNSNYASAKQWVD